MVGTERVSGQGAGVDAERNPAIDGRQGAEPQVPAAAPELTGNAALSAASRLLPESAPPDVTGFRARAQERALAWPLDPVRVADAMGAPETQRSYGGRQFADMWKNVTGAEMSAKQRDCLGDGCIGLARLRLGQLDNRRLTGGLHFGDTQAHDDVGALEAILGPAEVAVGKVDVWEQSLAEAKKMLEAAENTPGASIQEVWAAVKLHHLRKDGLEQALRKVELAESAIPGDRDALVSQRAVAKVAGGQRTLTRVLALKEKLDGIIAEKPPTNEEFLRLAESDKDLAMLEGLSDILPADISGIREWAVTAKHFYSGQAQQRAWLADAGDFIDLAPDMPDLTAFVPHPATGQVDMSGDLFLPKPGHIKYDYGVLSLATGEWWHADHDDDPADPMRIYRSSAEDFFDGNSSFDRLVLRLTPVDMNVVHPW